MGIRWPAASRCTALSHNSAQPLSMKVRLHSIKKSSASLCNNQFLRTDWKITIGRPSPIGHRGQTFHKKRCHANSDFMLRIGARPVNAGVQLLWKAIETTCQSAEGWTNCSLSLHAECRAQVFWRAENVSCLSCSRQQEPCLQELFSPGPPPCLRDQQCRQEGNLNIRGGGIAGVQELTQASDQHLPQFPLAVQVNARPLAECISGTRSNTQSMKEGEGATGKARGFSPIPVRISMHAVGSLLADSTHSPWA